MAAIVYLILVEIIRRLWDMMEWRMTEHLRPAKGVKSLAPPPSPEPIPVDAH